ncbi:MAG: Glu-tRNA(Gln) amidotransferase subunit GatD [Candidatus Aenigmarchaeota archaeon]|nr:Glu-tRNA(Gln) amidotransferase subunit GatD [Candidatus Aenigmarchaeota archaeon]
MEISSYSSEIQKALTKAGARIGDRVRVEKTEDFFEGMLMPKSQGADNTLIIKLDNGYNVGVAFDKGTQIKKVAVKEKESKKQLHIGKQKEDKGKPTVAILTMGGTVASRIDYKTGAVTPLETPEEMLIAVPELSDIANFRTRAVFQMLSENIEPEHWVVLSEKIADEIETGVDGIIVTHGTDTMHYTSAALSLMLQNLPIPVLLVGSQRSSDRGSSDASFNLICAAQFIAKSDFSGVAICMHGSSSDDFCHIHQGTHVKKTHTSRRDAFRSIDVPPYAKVYPNGTVEFLRTDYQKKDKSRKLDLAARFDRHVALVKMHPAFDYRLLDFLEKNGFRGIVLEGSGLGHAPIEVLDEYTKHHAELLKTIHRMSRSGIIIAMTSQCTYGKVNLNVYSPGRILQEAGVIPVAMTPETALVKLGWSLGHTRDSEKAKGLLLKDVAGEILERIDFEAFE